METFTMDEIFIEFSIFAKIGFQKCSRNWIFDFFAWAGHCVRE